MLIWLNFESANVCGKFEKNKNRFMFYNIVCIYFIIIHKDLTSFENLTGLKSTSTFKSIISI